MYFSTLGLREQKFHGILRRWDSVGRNSARSVAHFTIYNSKGRQSLAERLRRRQPTENFVGGRKPKRKHYQLPSLNWFPIG
ncbi:MAG: hypothetical protein LBU34_10980 [Planctomycetaceae bacterium]|nr:hypothetical protein [Planctomycetaceae bacterium]